ncbi:MAG: periplasmic heavy metal sensor [Myxococcota bacterium]|nr:periplasmic heavy metal sensor [Myxococcota bacterium]
MIRSLVLFSLLCAPLATASADPGEPDAQTKDQRASHKKMDKKHKVEQKVFEMIAEHGDELGLDEKAQQAIREIVDNHKERGDELLEELDIASEDLKSLMEQETPDLDSVLVQADVVMTLKSELFKQHLTTLIELREHLSEEQIRQIKGRVMRRMKQQKGHGHSHRNHQGHPHRDQ